MWLKTVHERHNNSRNKNGKRGVKQTLVVGPVSGVEPLDLLKKVKEHLNPRVTN